MPVSLHHKTQTIGDNTMNFLDGLKTIWSDPEIRKTAIKSTVAAVAILLPKPN